MAMMHGMHGQIKLTSTIKKAKSVLFFLTFFLINENTFVIIIIAFKTKNTKSRQQKRTTHDLSKILPVIQHS